ncbi:MAG: hypothetical protein GY750_14195 [Lentisphaerae bacterium]|nr:hypothetical protein [Lentisphaerota bacterium]MCP4102551.1 hypothetical protein [Lentisphaerota bacterium]
MSWDGKGFEKPLIMSNYETVQETIDKNAYVPDDDVRALIHDQMASEKLIFLLRSMGMTKEACDYMSYCMNRRVGVWWGYSCVEAINTEIEEQLKKSPLSFREQQKEEVKKKINALKDKSELDSILGEHNAKCDEFLGAMKKLSGPEITDKTDPLYESQSKILEAANRDNLDFAAEELQNAMGNMPPKQLSKAKQLVEKAFSIYEEQHGIHPMKQLEKEIMQSVAPEPIPEDTSIRDKYFGTIKQRCQEVKDYVNETINKHFPLKLPGLPKKPSKEAAGDAFFAAKRWILTPTNENGQKAFWLGKNIPNLPEGLCALTAFWSSSDLVPEQKEQIPPPPGLASNGIKNVIFMCAMKKGGSQTYDERYEQYFNLGIECMTGIQTWDKEWEKKPPRTEEELDDNLISKNGFGRENNIV